MEYTFNPEEAFNVIKSDWTRWADEVGAKKFVFGVSGGKDSTVVSYLAAKIFGSYNCYGVMMPNGNQKDIDDSWRVMAYTHINDVLCHIEDAYEAIEKNMMIDPHTPLSENAKINLAPRLRMATLYAVAQTVGGFVMNTDNLSERVLGYFTAYGDGAGDYAPLRGLTATEVVKLGEWLGVPDDLIHKKPGDGLQEKGDEERFGFTYADLDRYIRTGFATMELSEKVMARYNANKFKTQIVNIPGPKFDNLENYIVPQ